MRVLILGGTGAIGLATVNVLCERGVDVTVTSRRAFQPKTGVKVRVGDAHKIPFIDSLLSESWDVIIDFMTYAVSEFEMRVEPLLDATDQYVFLSSGRVYADENGAITEKSIRFLDSISRADGIPSGDYALTKAIQEDLLADTGRSNWTIIRPYITYNYNRLQLGTLEKEDWLFRALSGRPIVFPKELLDCETTLTYAGDVGYVIASLLGQSGALGTAFNATGAEECNITWQEVIDIYSDVLNAFCERRVEVIYQSMEKFLEYRSLDTQIQMSYDRLYNRRFDTANISKFLSVDSFMTPSVGLEKCVSQFLKNREFKGVNWGREALIDKSVGSRAAWSDIHGFKDKLRYFLRRGF